MRKNKLRVIQISGFRGILSAIFFVTCLTAGFVGFPAWGLHKLWNHISDITDAIPYIDMFQGLVLWGILAVSYMILNKKQRYLVAFEAKNASPYEIRNIVNEIRAQSGHVKKSAEIESFSTQPMDSNEIKISDSNNQKNESEEKTKEAA